ncbi:hypothetical protein SDRG_12505 [Saprolegnia diclina VS20]|uniref:Uncharacterized protein n=1 Tax=Saprolegnia diclina (strain VS20) TaxID=1156394 RepID=T0RBZ7_SAPDV|nr:hypothetical protein SDRG_12505 [Saprolegnia diclina VS20]EQC29733.1 hypothetical protein SDRG_12505 [Saprolegnia diclina VS20]|eukprot:XP_008616799.1 hypothetical protein SDRG_12505 [Saprolegnia diclina VS20]
MAASTVLRSFELVAAVVAYQSGLPAALVAFQRLVDTIEFEPFIVHRPTCRRIPIVQTSFGHLTNIPTRFARLPYLQRYKHPRKKLSHHALFVSPMQVDPALALHLTIVEGNMAIVEQWLRHKPALISSGALELAAASSQGAILRLLYERYPELATPKMMNLVAMAGDLTPLRWLHEAGAICTTAAMDGAAMNGHLDVVIFLHEARTEGCTNAAVTTAVRNGHAPIVFFLLQHGYEHTDMVLLCSTVYDDIRTRYVLGTSHLEAIDVVAPMIAVDALGLCTLTQRLGLASLRYCCDRGYQTVTPQVIEMAAAQRDHAMLRYALHILRQTYAPEADVAWRPPNDDDNFVSWDRCEAMDLAACFGDEIALQLLHDSRLECKAKKATRFASYYGHVNVLRWLHRHGRLIDNSMAMELAACMGHADVVRWLVEVGGQAPTRTALAMAAANNHFKIVQYLVHAIGDDDDAMESANHRRSIVPLPHGPDETTFSIVEYRSCWHVSGRAADWAASNGHLETLRYLLAHGRGVSAHGMDGAIASGHLAVVALCDLELGLRCSHRQFLSKAILGDHGAVVEYVLTRHCWRPDLTSDEVMVDLHVLHLNAATCGNVDLWRMIVTAFPIALPERVQERIVVRAAAKGHLALLRLVVETCGYPLTPFAIKAATQCGRKRVLQYLMTRGPPCASLFRPSDRTSLFYGCEDGPLFYDRVAGHLRMRPL